MIIEIFEQLVRESSIDFPRDGLDPQVWTKYGDKYVMRDDVVDTIFNVLRKYSDENLDDSAEKIRVVGSICSNQYTDDTDIDIHIVPSIVEEWPEDRVKEVKAFFDDDPSYIGEHPIEVYVQVNEDQDLMSVGAYDLLSNTWEAGPTILPSTFNPYKLYSDLAPEIERRVERADDLLAELKRDVIDYDSVVDAMSHLDCKSRGQLAAFLQSKLEEIEQGIQALYAERKKWTDARQEASTGKTSPDKEWRNENAVFKFLDKYGYLRLLGDLNKIIETDGLEQEDVSVVADKLGIDHE